KFLVRKIFEAAVIKPSACYFMAACDHLAYQRRVLLGNPAKHEKRSLSIVFVENIERFTSVLLVARLEICPVSLLDEVLECADVEIVFDQDGEQKFLFFRCRIHSNLRQIIPDEHLRLSASRQV